MGTDRLGSVLSVHFPHETQVSLSLSGDVHALDQPATSPVQISAPILPLAAHSSCSIAHQHLPPVLALTRAAGSHMPPPCKIQSNFILAHSCDFLKVHALYIQTASLFGCVMGTKLPAVCRWDAPTLRATTTRVDGNEGILSVYLCALYLVIRS